MSDRSWAVGLKQPEFEREYLRRQPGADVIPDVTLWAVGSEPVYRHIDSPDPENFQPDGEVPVSKGAPTKKHLGYPCRGCGRAFDYKIARAGHERGCKEAITKKMDAKEEAENV